MNKDLSIDNVKLIYEFNKLSPLFSRVAYFEIEQGNYLYALEILEKGIETNPHYPTAYFISALAKAYSGDELGARQVAKKGAKLISSQKTLDAYNKKIDEIISEKKRASDQPGRGIKRKDEEFIEENQFFNIEDRLDVLAEKLSKAKIKVNYNDEPEKEIEVPEFKGKRIVSETLAGIYLAQKKNEEAISIYYELIDKYPDKKDYFTKKIVEIETLMKW
jgi:tetratricopeptide (TPR) repeat protein